MQRLLAICDFGGVFSLPLLHMRSTLECQPLWLASSHSWEHEPLGNWILVKDWFSQYSHEEYETTYWDTKSGDQLHQDYLEFSRAIKGNGFLLIHDFTKFKEKSHGDLVWYCSKTKWGISRTK